MARWRKQPEAQPVPQWVLDEWVNGGDPDGLAGAWLDSLWYQDPERGYEAFIALISVPAYTVPR